MKYFNNEVNGLIVVQDAKNSERITNLTPHDITVFKGGKAIMLIPPSGQVARINAYSVPLPDLNGLPVQKTKFGYPIDLPGFHYDEDERAVTEDESWTHGFGVMIVSAMVRNAVPYRSDLVSPARLVRDENNKVIGCEAFDWNSDDEEDEG